VTEAIVRSDVHVRPLRFDEIGALAAAVEEISEAQVANRWREQELGYRELLVAELDGELVGTVSLHAIGGRGGSMHLFALEVAPRVRNRGVGTALIRYVLEEAARRGCVRVFLEVSIENRARRLYHRLGFRRIGRPFINSWWLFNADGSRERIEQLSLTMVRRVTPTP
jgi:ribosomal protein S18 acetylase RimI-like enzyme